VGRPTDDGGPYLRVKRAASKLPSYTAYLMQARMGTSIGMGPLRSSSV
jgi:hypothetical protein